MRMTTKSAFALASVLTLSLAGCAGDQDDVTGDEEEDDTSEVDEGTNGDEGDEGGDAEAAGTIESVDELVIGLVPSTDAASEVTNAEALADQLSEALDDFPVTIFQAEDFLGVIQAMNSGDVHLVMSGPVGVIQAEDEAGGTPILQAIRYGSDTYVTQWFTNDPDTYCLDEPVDVDGYLFCNGTGDPDAEPGPMGEEALELIPEGESVSYVDQGSASGFYFPQVQLGELGVTIDPQFSGSHDNAVLNVYNGNTAIGTSFDDARTNVTDEAPDVGEEVVVFAWAGPIPNDGIAASGDLTDEEQELITEAFLSFSESADLGEGDPLFDVYDIEGLTRADAEALDLARQVYQEFGN